ncbi:MAG: amidohydrolase family protein [Casimicrobium sp.]
MKASPNTYRRHFLRSAAALAASPVLTASAFRIDQGGALFNPCGELSAALREHEFTQSAFANLNWNDVWDSHTHLLGMGESGSGAWVSPEMMSPVNLRQYAQFRFYLNAACVKHGRDNTDQTFLARLLRLLGDFPTGCRAMVLAFDRTHAETGAVQSDLSAFYLPNQYAADVAAKHAARMQWVASIHPYRADAAEAVANAVAQGAVAVKWLPPAMGIDPASKHCDAFYDAMAKFDVPLISHGGEEKAVHGAGKPEFGNVLKLRRPLERGVRVVVAHCASLGMDTDLDKGANGPSVTCFSLFERLMASKAYVGRLFGDVSALPQSNRIDFLPRVVKHEDWASRLVNGSDYPLPGVFPLFSVDAIVERGWLDASVGAHIKQVRQGNPMLFDFLLKRHLRVDGQSFSNATFESARVFRRARVTAERNPASLAL